MRLLIDMNLSPDRALLLREKGFEALHWSVTDAYSRGPSIPPFDRNAQPAYKVSSDCQTPSPYEEH
ncbi:MAG: hypothetical protein PHC88_05750 [Terrimicrobiaceae bacterium]|nr:hypothetical protein [Terrimicrobiaceae bacterium]